MRTKTTTVYTPAELKEAHPSAFDRVLSRWADSCTDITWGEETLESLKAVIDACGASLKNYSLSADSSDITVRCDDEDDNGELKDGAWMLREVLTPNGYTKDGRADFPGHCKWTGYCADDDFIEAAYLAMEKGDTLTEALEGLASTATTLLRADLQQAQGEESMMANWEDREFDADGNPA